MKKIILLLTVASCFGLQLQAQNSSISQPANSSKTAIPVVQTEKAPMSFMHTKTGFSANENVLLKNGGIPAVSVAFTDDFSMPNDTVGLKARGYKPYYRGAGPMGTTAAWFQGNATVFGDFNGGTDAYVGSNYNSVTATNNIDNWLVLPALNIASGDVISFYSQAPLASTYPDSIRVMYSAAGDSVPEGLTWVELGRFKVNTTGAWLQSTYSAPAAGATARFAIRYTVAAGGPTGNNSDYIGIDQLDVFTPSTVDLEALSVNALSAAYTRIPLTQFMGGTLTSSVKNNGSAATSTGTVTFEVEDTVSLAVVFTEVVNLPSINPGASVVVNTTNSFNPIAAGFLRPKVTVNIAGDGNSANDIKRAGTTNITDSIYARDNNLSTGSLGIGAGPSNGIVGQNFTVNNASSITSVSFFLNETMNPNPAGTPVHATIHSQLAGGTPNNTSLASTTTVMITPGMIPTGGQWFTLPIVGSSLAVTPGIYYVGVHEADSLLTLGTTTQIVTPNTVWVTWSTIPTPPAVNGWATAQQFNFNVTYNLRLNFGTTTGIENAGDSESMLAVYPSPTNGELNINLGSSITNANVKIYNSLNQLVKTISNADGNIRLDVSTYAKGIYTVTVNDNKKTYTQRFTVVH